MTDMAMPAAHRNGNRFMVDSLDGREKRISRARINHWVPASAGPPVVSPEEQGSKLPEKHALQPAVSAQLMRAMTS
jgi:hypothetical protein